jgi:tellurite resistance protein TehA-like permease
LPRAVKELFPGYFALVMATGIVSVASFLLGMRPLALALLAVNVIAYVWLGALTLARLVLYPRLVLDDLASHQRGPGFFTVVAGTCVLGTQVFVLTGQRAVPWTLWGIGFALWLAIVYAFFTVITVKPEKPTLPAGINGSWLLVIVATQAVSVLGSLIVRAEGAWREELLFLTLCLYLIGCLLYLVFITLIVYRFTFFPLDADQLTPPYWINMGAVAITTLAGAVLMLRAGDSTLLAELLPFVKGLTIFFWAWGTWWIPLLVILGVWRHVVRRHPLTYDPQYWGLVFPLGMYTTCTIRLSQVLDTSFLMLIPRYFVWVALAAWAITFAGMVRSVLGGGTPTRPGSSPS